MINKFIRFFCIYIPLFLSVNLSLAQPDPSSGYFIQHFTDENGLPQNSINDLLFDDEGYLWLGSQVGLVRFNGHSFKLFYPDDKPVMESDVISLGKNSRGHIYFQTDDNNLYCYPGNNSHRLSPMNTLGLRDPRLLNTRSQLFDFTHFLHPGGAAGKRQQIFQYLFAHNDSFFAVDSLHVYILYNDSCYYYDNKALQALTLRRGTGQHFMVLDKKFYVLDGDSILSVYQDGKVLGQGGRIAPDRSQGKEERHRSFRLFSSGNNAHILAGSRFYRIHADPDGRLTAEFLLDLGFISNITTIEYNRELDLLLVASGTDGFYTFRKSRFGPPGVPPNPVLKQRLSSYLFGPIAVNKTGEILTDRFIFDASGRYRPVKDSMQPWRRTLFVDKNDQVWSAFYNLPRRSNRGMEVVKVYPTLDAPVVDYGEDDKGNLYCLTERSLWRKEADSFRLLFDRQYLSPDGANECLGRGDSGRLLIGNIKGLIEYDPFSGLAKAIPLLSGAHVRSVYQCRDGSVLVGTYGQGYYYQHHGPYIRMPLDKNGFLITAHCFLEDQHENIWIPCNKGLFRVPKADLDAWCESDCNAIYYYHYGQQDGLLTNEFNGGYHSSGVMTPDGFAALLSMKGVVCYQTDSLQAEFPRGRVSITNVEIDGLSGGKFDSIVLSQDYNSLLLEISCPFLGDRNNLYLDYRLKGLDSAWKPVPEDGVVNLSRLSPGNYALQVRKVNGFGKSNYSYRQWPIAVIPHFYRTTWFRTLAAATLLLLILLLVQLWLKLIEKRKEVRVKAEKLKGTVVTLEETIKKLQESEKALMHTSQLREKLISLVIHDLRSPLRFLTMLAGDLHDNQALLSPEEIKERTYWIKKGTHDIYHFSEDFLLWVTSQKDNFSITKSLFPLRPLLQEIYDFFREQVAQKGNTIHYEAVEDLSIYSDPHILITIIRNLVDNANKYTEKGAITLTGEEKDAHIIITVADTGRGMSPEQVSRFFHMDNLDDVQTGSQLGHKFVFDLTLRIGGTVSIESWPGAGTLVRIKLPKGG